MISKAGAVARSFEVELTMLIGRSGDKPPNVTQLEFLYDLAKIAPDGPAVEIGVLYGGSLVCWAAARAGRGPIIAVDNWSLRGTAQRTFPGNMERYGLDVQRLDVDSWDAPAMIEEQVAFCFIDSDHVIGPPRDIPAWTEKMMPAGIIAFHDYGVWKPHVTVKTYVDLWDANAQWERMGLVGSTIAFRRPG